MGKINVYLPDELEQRVRDAGLVVSAICQTALRTAVDTLQSLRLRGEGSFTPRLTEILDDLRARAGAEGRQVTAADLFGGIVTHRENLGARALELMGVELPAMKEGRASKGDGSLDDDARAVLADAYRVALEMRHGWIGTEHVVLALAMPASPLAHLFTALGIEPQSLRRQIERLIANPWTTESTPPADLYAIERLDAEVQRLAAELDRLKGRDAPTA
jgi:ATP-dependent Clp protease ATP-binding subunit ClpC